LRRAVEVNAEAFGPDHAEVGTDLDLSVRTLGGREKPGLSVGYRRLDAPYITEIAARG
jgi:hypothetical protein